MTCKCKICLYGKKVGSLIDRTRNARDRALIDDLYNRLMHAEDDRDFSSVKNEACGLKHGGISFTDACEIVSAAKKRREIKGTWNAEKDVKCRSTT